MIVIDASVATKLLNTQEPDSENAAILLAAHIEGKERIIVPSLLYLEVANALVTKTTLSEGFIKEGLQLLNGFGFTIHSFTKADLIQASLLAKKHHTTVYDMLYAVVAKENKCSLITADEQFVKKTKFPFVKFLSA